MQTSSGYLYGWDSSTGKWVRILVDTNGNIVVSTS